MKNAKTLVIDEVEYNTQNPLIIAELGTSHGGDLSKAKEMIAAAAEAGASCIKLQMVYADEILHPNTGEVALPGGTIRLYNRFKELEMPSEFYAEIKEFIESWGVLFLCTPFGMKSAGILQGLEPKVVKIASPELNYSSLLHEVAYWEMPVLLSCGVSTLKDIEQAVEILRSSGSSISHCLLHCVTAYPAPETEYNLRVLQCLSAVFDIAVGVSDHSLDPEIVPVLAITQGAVVIEKHFCLSRNDPGLDDLIDLPPDQFARMTSAIHHAAAADPDETIKNMIQERGAKTIKTVLGNGVKDLAPSERDNYMRTNRSIHALRDIQAGQVITSEDVAVLRTERNLRPGLAPSLVPKVCGRTAKQFIPAGEGIRLEDV